MSFLRPFPKASSSSQRMGTVFLSVATIAALGLSACSPGCRRHDGHVESQAPAPIAPIAPTLRLYFVADAAGALEPCGCTKDMLGGVDKLSALIARRPANLPHALFAVGPTFFMNERARPERAEQDLWNAEALADGLKACGLLAFTPGKNDWLAGVDVLAALQQRSGATAIASNLTGAAAKGLLPHRTQMLAGVRVDVLGVSVPRGPAAPLSDLTFGVVRASLATEARKARAEGARIVVALAAMERAEAVRLAEATPELDVLAIGSPSLDGDANDAPRAARFVGPVLVVQPSNHLTRVAAVDFHLRDAGRFEDGSGIAQSEQVELLKTQLTDLERRLALWQSDPKVSAKELAEQVARRDALQARLQKLAGPVSTPRGSYLRYELLDVRASAGSTPELEAVFSAYYQRVNEHNRLKFKDAKAAAPLAGSPWFVGTEVCKTCHVAPYNVWQRTKHASAYATLVQQHKQYNLDCVGCHVTGYDKAGGSTVVDNEAPNLRDVQCEQCHGPGSQHIEDPLSFALVSQPDETVCKQCHHPPHTELFDYKARLFAILGPGHGKPGAPQRVDPPKGWVPSPPRFPKK